MENSTDKSLKYTHTFYIKLVSYIHVPDFNISVKVLEKYYKVSWSSYIPLGMFENVPIFVKYCDSSTKLVLHLINFENSHFILFIFCLLTAHSISGMAKKNFQFSLKIPQQF